MESPGSISILVVSMVSLELFVKHTVSTLAESTIGLIESHTVVHDAVFTHARVLI